MMKAGMGHNQGSGMGHDQGEPTVLPFPRCTACDDVIGVYEPLIHVFGGAARRTSLTADPQACLSGGRCYHLECYERLADGA
jgi:hypothetical protein